jgi:hypothetical protein
MALPGAIPARRPVMRIAYRLALVQWWVALILGAWLLIWPGPGGFASIAASSMWCLAGAQIVALRGGSERGT